MKEINLDWKTAFSIWWEFFWRWSIFIILGGLLNGLAAGFYSYSMGN
jgi:hypothetical protein